MKWKTEIPNKSEFLKSNTFNLIENEKNHSDLVHEKNVGTSSYGQPIQAKETRTEGYKENKEQRTMTETVVLTESKTDFTGSAPKRYTTTCYIQPTTVPYWYTESLLLKIGSTKRNYQETVHFKNKYTPVLWSEQMVTDVKTGPKCILAEKTLDCDDEKHYMSLEPQQLAATSTDL